MKFFVLGMLLLSNLAWPCATGPSTAGSVHGKAHANRLKQENELRSQILARRAARARAERALASVPVREEAPAK